VEGSCEHGIEPSGSIKWWEVLELGIHGYNMLGTTEKDTYLTKFKAGGRFAIYAFGIHLAATFTIGCLGLIVGSPLLTFPLAMLISRPVV
jgi:hypothetical protein